jgi:uracil-DNA glycosylase
VSARLEKLLGEIRACRVCAAHLPHPPRPTLRARASARLLVVGQAPGARVYKTGIPWDDPSGERLRAWMQVTKDVFYDEKKIALIPAAFCYPGTKGSGDLPPRSECAPLWHPRLRQELQSLEFTLLVGSYAQQYYLGTRMKPSLTETVQSFREYLPRFLPLPHPSWHNNQWIKLNPWFGDDVLPELQRRVHALLA